MSYRSFRRIVLAVVVLGTVSLAPLPAQARETGWRDVGGVARVTRQLGRRGLLGAFQDALRRLFALSRGGMDPNGES